MTPDIDDVGFRHGDQTHVECGWLMDDELLGLAGASAPTFVSPDTRANAQCTGAEERGADLLLHEGPSTLDTIMQGLWTDATGPLEDQYFNACRTCS